MKLIVSIGITLLGMELFANPFSVQENLKSLNSDQESLLQELKAISASREEFLLSDEEETAGAPEINILQINNAVENVSDTVAPTSPQKATTTTDIEVVVEKNNVTPVTAVVEPTPETEKEIVPVVLDAVMAEAGKQAEEKAEPVMVEAAAPVESAEVKETVVEEPAPQVKIPEVVEKSTALSAIMKEAEQQAEEKKPVVKSAPATSEKKTAVSTDTAKLYEDALTEMMAK